MKNEQHQELLKKLLDSNQNKQPDDNGDFKGVRVDDYEQQHKDISLKREQVKSEILDFVLTTSIDTSKEIVENEKKKTKARRLFIIILTGVLIVSLVYSAVMIVLDATGKLALSQEIFIAFSATVIAQIVSLMVLFVRFINDIKSLEMYKIVTHKLLDYLAKIEEN
ncbi:MAG: hypothetical protein FWD84_05255 [Oscillospiraceae bacterium]|nr:hypothetical protein [Oscillospiraceae bacterium]